METSQLFMWIGLGIIAFVVNAIIIRIVLDFGKLIKQNETIIELLKKKD